MSTPCPSPKKCSKKTRQLTLSIDCEAFPEASKVDLVRFQGSIFPAIKGNSQLDASVHWRQIESIIKGSVEAVMQGSPLTSEQYLNQKVFHSKRCGLNEKERRDVYAVYAKYRQLQKREGYWDDVDRVNNMTADSVQEHPPTPSKNDKKETDSPWAKLFMCFTEI